MNIPDLVRERRLVVVQVVQCRWLATPQQAKPTLLRIPAETFSRSLLVMLVMLMMLILILLILGGLILIFAGDVGDAKQL